VLQELFDNVSRQVIDETTKNLGLSAENITKMMNLYGSIRNTKFINLKSIMFISRISNLELWAKNKDLVSYGSMLVLKTSTSTIPLLHTLFCRSSQLLKNYRPDLYVN
jgi:hypothetical protein